MEVWKMIFLFKQVIFRFQPFIFQGVILQPKFRPFVESGHPCSNHLRNAFCSWVPLPFSGDWILRAVYLQNSWYLVAAIYSPPVLPETTLVWCAQMEDFGVVRKYFTPKNPGHGTSYLPHPKQMRSALEMRLKKMNLWKKMIGILKIVQEYAFVSSVFLHNLCVEHRFGMTHGPKSSQTYVHANPPFERLNPPPQKKK